MDFPERRHAVAFTRPPYRISNTDAAQTIEKLPVDVRASDVDLLFIVGRKLYAPKGVGARYVRRGLVLEPTSHGGAHERVIRPGTENVASIVGLGVACAIARRDLERESAAVRSLRDWL